MTEREPYTSPAEPVVVGAIEASENSYSPSGSDFGFYSSLLT